MNKSRLDADEQKKEIREQIKIPRNTKERKYLDKFVVKGGRRLEGEVTISGAKNAAVAILPAVILSDEPCVIENVPYISDVRICIHILEEMGA